ncbi:MAG: MlaD family protein [Pseudomonadota bacterium]
METRASSVLVGLFVVVLVVGLAAFSLWLGRFELERSVHVYEVTFSTSVAGLQNGAQVSYKGIPVGRVNQIRFDPKNFEHVLVRIEVDPTTPVNVDTYAQLAPQGITGVFFMQLEGGTAESARLETTASHPATIPGRPSTFDRLATDFPEIITQGIVLLDRATKLLDEKNIEAVGQTIANVALLTETLAERRQRFSALVDDAGDLVAELRSAVATANEALVSIDTAAAAFATDLPELTATGNTTLEDFGAAAKRLQSAAAQADGLLRDVRGPMRDFSERGLYEFGALIAETRQLVAAATRISREFERDPAGFLLGGGYQGFKAE